MQILIFDIGKTNKKWVIYNERFEIIDNHSIKIPEIKDEDGNPCEDIKGLTDWVELETKKLLSRSDLNISHLNFSAYGATVVHLDADDQVCSPVYNYLNETAEDDLQQFQHDHGSLSDFAIETGSPFTGMLNTGFQLYWLKKRKPRLFAKIKTTVHLPQYLSYLFTNKLYTETTSLGCHTGLWNFNTNEIHRWLIEENIDSILPPLAHSWKLREVNIAGKIVKVGIGIHDSSAALVPYLKANDNPFLLLSTGTWSIALNPFDKSMLETEDIKNDILLYLQPDGNPVRASRLFLGRAYANRMKEIDQIYGNNKVKYELAELALNEKMAKQHYDSILMAINNTKVDSVYVDGGFASNMMFLKKLSEMLSPIKVYYASKPMGSAFGAAVVMQDIEMRNEDFWKIYDVKSVQ